MKKLLVFNKRILHYNSMIRILIFLLCYLTCSSVTFAQHDYAEVSNDLQLSLALENPEIEKILLQPGFYSLFNIEIKGMGGKMYVRHKNNCDYVISTRIACFPGTLTATVYTIGDDCPPDNSGWWVFPDVIKDVGGSPYDPLQHMTSMNTRSL